MSLRTRNYIKSHIFIAPPGAGKTAFKNKKPGLSIDPEESIDWRLMDSRYTLYQQRALRNHPEVILEHELDWPTVWTREVLPRLRAALVLRKNIIMGMIAPSSAEIVSRFLKEFHKDTTLILPDEELHFQQVWNDKVKRLKTWGPQLRGWQHTFWLRLLLLGLATDLGLKIVKKPKFPKVYPNYRVGLAAREATHGNQKKFVEVFFGRWAELNKNEEIVAMHVETGFDKNGIYLKCDKTSKACGRKMHNCKLITHLKKDVYGNDLTAWIAQDKLRIPKRGQKNALIFFAGTLAPFHHGHLDALNSAKAFLESKGWNVVGGYASVFKKINDRRIDDIYSIFGSVEHRSSMLQLGTMRSDWLMADFPTQHVLRSSRLEQGDHPMQFLAKRLRKCGALSSEIPITTFWVNGKDAYMDSGFFKDFARHTDSDKLNPLRILIIDNRIGKDAWTRKRLAVAAPNLLPFIARHKLHQSNPTSATAVRNALKTSNRKELKQLVGLPLVESYLMGLMHTQAIRQVVTRKKGFK